MNLKKGRKRDRNLFAKRAVALLMAMVLCFSFVPSAALAKDSKESTATTAATENIGSQSGLEIVESVNITGTEEGEQIAAELSGDAEVTDEPGLSTGTITVPQYDTAERGDDSWKAAVEAACEAIANLEESVYLSEYEIPEDEISNLYSEIRMKCYLSFYISSRVYYQTTSTGIIWALTFMYVVDEDEAAEKKAELDSVIESIVAGADESWSELEKTVYLNIYLTKNCEYDLTYVNHTAYDALVTGVAVCQGYANAFYVLATELGVECELVTSTELNHAWNVVNIGGSFYHVDTTWDDPVPDTERRALFTYFLKSSDYFQTTGKHTADDWVITDGLTEEDVASTTYDDETWWIFSGIGGAVYIDGLWYTMEVPYVYTYSCDGVSFTENETLFSIADVMAERRNSTYSGYSSFNMGNAVAAYGGHLYYAVLDQVICYDLDEGTHTVVYELTEEQVECGWIWDIWVQEDSTVELRLMDNHTDNGYVEAFRILDSLTIERLSAEDGNISAALLLAIVGDRDCEQLVFSHTVALSTAEIVQLDSLESVAGDKAVLLQQDSDGKLIYVNSALIVNGTVSLTFEQYADSAVVYGYNGDVTGDGAINASDTLMILRGVSGRATLDAVQEGFADVNLDGTVNSNDLLAVVKYVSGRTGSLN